MIYLYYLAVFFGTAILYGIVYEISIRPLEQDLKKMRAQNTEMRDMLETWQEEDK